MTTRKNRTSRILEAAISSLDNAHSFLSNNTDTSFTVDDFEKMPFDIVEEPNELSTKTYFATEPKNDNDIVEADITPSNIFDLSYQFDGPEVISEPDNHFPLLETTALFTPVDQGSPELFPTLTSNETSPVSTNQEEKKIKLVDYDTSSENSSENLPENNPSKVLKNKSIRVSITRRLSSETSFSLENNTSKELGTSDESLRKEAEDSVVGSTGLRRKRRPNKKNMKKAEKNFGTGKEVKRIPCKTRCQNNCIRNFTESERHDIHEFYWGLGSYERQRNWLLSLIDRIPVRRRYQDTSVSRRQNTFKYNVSWNEKRIEVCQQFLLSTLNISQMTLRYAVNNAVQKSAKPDQRGKHVPHNKTTLQVKLEVHEFIKKLPAVPSHYCRNKSSRKYLSNELRNVSFLYRIFLREQDAKSSNTKPSLKIFKQIFLEDFNLGFHQPKKDKCRVCECRKDVDYLETEASKKAFDDHLSMKEQSKELFLMDQKKHLDDELSICASFDLQKVLNTPHGDNLLLYYSRKYSFFNETVYESGTREGICYIWGESDGNRGCNEICSIIFKYLSNVDCQGLKQNVMIYCDSCSGQNKNRAMLLMLQTFLQTISKHIKTIRIVFLLPGHTYMPVDSVHATIERFVRKRIVWAPSDWEITLRNARINPKPFEVVKMEHTDFNNWKKLGDERLPSNAKTSQGLPFKISLVKQATFVKGKQNFAVNYTYDSTSEVDILMPTVKGRKTEYAQLYSKKLCIPVLRKRDLEKLCTQNIIPKKYRQEFIELKSKASVKESLPETDDEDETENEDE